MELASPKRPGFDMMGCLSDCGAAASDVMHAAASAVVMIILGNFITTTPLADDSLMTLSAALQACQDSEITGTVPI